MIHDWLLLSDASLRAGSRLEPTCYYFLILIRFRIPLPFSERKEEKVVFEKANFALERFKGGDQRKSRRVWININTSNCMGMW
jgi:hypothetical protein